MKTIITKFKKAFTLVELAVYMGVVTIVMTGVVNFAWTVIGSGQKSTVQQEVFSSARITGEILKNTIRKALEAEISSDFGINLADNPGSTLSLTVPGSGSPTVVDVDGGRVRISSGGGAGVYVSSPGVQVTDLTFTNYSSADGKSRNISFTLTVQSAYSGTSRQYQAEASLESAAEIRNN